MGWRKLTLFTLLVLVAPLADGAPISAPPSSIPTPNAATDVTKQQDQAATTTKCFDALNEVFGALKDLEKAKCQVVAKIPDCSDHITCNPKARQKNPQSKEKIANPGIATAKSSSTTATKSKTPIGDTAQGDDSTSSRETKATSQKSSPASRDDSDAPTTTQNADTSDEENAALDRCNSLADQANSACSDNGDDDSTFSSIGDGLSAACQDLQNAGLSSAKKKNDLAKACQTAYMSCTQTCSGYADTYSESDNWSTFNSKSRTCLALSSRAKEMLKASSASLDGSKAGMNCFSDSSSPTNSAGDLSKTSPASASSSCVGANCNPSASGGAQGVTAATAEGGLGDASSKKSASGFDVGDTSNDILANPFGGAEPASSPAAPRVTPIANNSGGAIPGGAGAPHSSPAPSNGSLWDQMKSKVTDIQRGLFGGGGGSQLASAAPPAEDDPNAPTVFSGYDSMGQPIYRSRLDPASLSKKEDFKRYLPGGDLFRGTERSPANAPVIYGPAVDIWSRITNRMIVKCKLGELYDCQLP